MKLVIKKGLPVGVTTNECFRAFYRVSPHLNISKGMFRDVVLVITELEERDIGVDMKRSSRGSTIYNRLTKCGTRCLGLFACYVKKVKKIENGKTK